MTAKDNKNKQYSTPTNRRLKEPEISSIDLFCGVGGLTHGLIKAGIKVRVGIDLDESCKYAYEANNKAKFIGNDIPHLAQVFQRIT